MAALSVISEESPYSIAIEKLDELTHATPVERTVGAMKRWLAELELQKNEAKTQESLLLFPVDEDLSTLADETWRRVEALETHLTATTRGRSDEEKYFLSPLVRQDLDAVECIDVHLGRKRASGGTSNIHFGEMGCEARAFKIPQAGLPNTFIRDESIAFTRLPEHPGILKSGLVLQATAGKLLQSLEKGTGDATNLFRNLDNTTEKELKALFSSTGDALCFLGENGYVLHDYKPANIIRTDDGRYVLSDLEMLFPIGTSFCGGTMDFIAPESFSTRKTHPSRDVYSFGASVLAAYTGRGILTSKNPADVSCELIKLTDTIITQRIAANIPSEASERLRLSLEDDACTATPLVDKIRIYPKLFEHLSIITQTESVGFIRELKETLVAATKEVAGSPSHISYSLKSELIDSIPDDSRVKRAIVCIFSHFTLLSKALAVDSITTFLTLPIDKQITLNEVIKRSPPEFVNSGKLRAGILDSEGTALHLARCCMRREPSERPSMRVVLSHPYFTREGTVEEWSLAHGIELPSLSESAGASVASAASGGAAAGPGGGREESYDWLADESSRKGPNPFAIGADPALLERALERGRKALTADAEKRARQAEAKALNPFARGADPRLIREALERGETAWKGIDSLTGEIKALA